VKPRDSRALCPSLLVTTMSTLPALPAGDVAVIEVLLATSTEEAGVEPKRTVAPPLNPLPLIATTVPPLTAPVWGAAAETAGGAATGVSKL
jgi:hypothetical protein